MKKLLFVGLLLLISTSAFSAESKIEFGMLIVSSPEYQELLDGAYDRAGRLGKDEGINGWFGFYLGKRFYISSRLSIAPLFEYMITYVDVASVSETSISTSYLGGGTWYTNMIFLPTINARYFLNDKNSLYISGEINYNIPRTWSNNYELSSGGVGFGGSIGFQFSNNEKYGHIELGYMYVPVEVSLWKTENIAGGYMLKFGRDF